MRTLLPALVVALFAGCVPSLDSRCDTNGDCEKPLVCDDEYCVPPRTGQQGPKPDGSMGDRGPVADEGVRDEGIGDGGMPPDEGKGADASDAALAAEMSLPDGPATDGPTPDGPAAV